MNDNEIVKLLKHGRGDEVKAYIEEKKKENYPPDFRSFMDRMLSERHISRKQVAVKSGLSQDYTYKLLRGDKKTTERDYIIAICIAMKLNIAQIQHALCIYGMPILNHSDLRSHVIYLAIENHLDIDELNEWLETSGFPLLKTSPDMPSAPIELSGEAVVDFTRNMPEQIKNQKHTYKEINRQIEAVPDGNAPMDFSYWGIIKVEDEEGKKYYVEASYSREGDNLIVLDEPGFLLREKWMKEIAEAKRAFYEKHKELCDDPAKLLQDADAYEEYQKIMIAESPVVELEQYSSLEEARASEFFKFFLQLDQATDEKVVETMSHIDDTRNYGVRIGCGIMGGRRVCFLEAFDTGNLAERQYFQIVQKDDEYTFSASHESYYMRLELGELYPIYFGEKSEPEYYIKVHSTTELDGDYLRLRFVFNSLLFKMHEYLNEIGSFMDFDDNKILEEKVETLIEEAVWLYHCDKFSDSIELLKQAVQVIKNCETQEHDNTVTLACTYGKIALTYSSLNDRNNELYWWKETYELKDKIQDLMAADVKNIECAVSSVAEAALNLSQEQQNNGNNTEAKRLVEESIELLEGYCCSQNDWITLFQAYQKYAFLIDGDEPERAIGYSRKAIVIARDQHLDQVVSCQIALAVLYNNHAWVLWNRLESEEAIIYYGRAIELLEGYLAQGKLNSERVKTNLLHVGKALYELYIDTDRQKEAARLEARLKESGVVITEAE